MDVFKNEFLCAPYPPRTPDLTDEELDFMSMAIPLKELVKGIGGHEVPQDVVTLAHCCIDAGYGDDVIDRLRQIFAIETTTMRRMTRALEQTLRHAAQGYRNRGGVQAAAELEERNIAHPHDIDTHFGRMSVDFRVHAGTGFGYVSDALLATLAAIKTVSDGRASPVTYQALMSNLERLTVYAETGDEVDPAWKGWIAILDEWLSEPHAESRP